MVCALCRLNEEKGLPRTKDGNYKEMLTNIHLLCIMAFIWIGYFMKIDLKREVMG